MSFEDVIRYELNRAGATVPIVGVDLDRTMSRGRSIRRRKIVANVATAAAVIAVVVAGGALITSSPEPEPRPGPAGSPSGQTTPEETPSPGEDQGDQGRPSFTRVEPVLREWLTAIQQSDEVRAWQLMSPEAQAAVERSEFDQMMESALPEGLGAFADAENFHHIVVTSEGDKVQVVAVASGEVTREGSTEFAAMAIPMEVTSDGAFVDDPIIDRARYYDRNAVFASASLGPQPYRAGDEFIVEFAQPAGATGVYISLDDDRRPLDTKFDPSTGRATASLDRDLQAGRHIATVVVVHSSGRLYPEAIIFEAAE